MTIYTHTHEQHAQLKAIRLQLIDLGDTKTAAMLDWVEEAVPIADDEVLVSLKRPEGYEDVHPQIVSEDAIGDRWPEYRTITKDS